MAALSVNACVCNDVTFRELIELAARIDPDRRLSENAMLEELSDRTRCATGCGSCRPYIRLALRTGQTTQPVMTPAAARAFELRASSLT